MDRRELLDTQPLCSEVTESDIDDDAGDNDPPRNRGQYFHGK